jgi:omega-6 fatty acid desaturase (delta-12 desaturase)
LSIDQIEPRRWTQILAAYQKPSLGRSVVEIILSAAPLGLIWAVAWVAAAFGLWWVDLLLAVPAAGFLLRLFMVQHDCGHRAFFRSARANDWIGRVLGVLTMTPHDCWRRTHAIHHATTGDLDRRGLGAIDTLTVAEYRALPAWRRFAYRLYRHPVVMFGLGPAFVFVVQHRWPAGLMREGWRPWLSAMGTNVAIALFFAVVLWFGGWQALLLMHVPAVLLAASIGVWLFYVQHQFEETYWARHGDWDFQEAALQGSSYYDLPGFLRWITANIGVHHVHHASSRIPFYRLQPVLRDHPELRDVGRISMFDSLRCVGLSLWDEAGQKLVSFRQSKRL